MTARLVVALVTPIALLVLVGVILAVAIMRTGHREREVERSAHALRVAHDAHRHIADQESSVRGYLLSRDRALLDRFIASDPQTQLQRLAGLVEDDPAQSLRVRELERRHAAWLAAARTAIDDDVARAREDVPALQARGQLMDGMRRTMEALVTAENDLLARRTQAARDSQSSAASLFMLLVAVAAVAIALISRGQLGRLRAIYRRAHEAREAARSALADEEWSAAGRRALASALRGDRSVSQLAGDAVRALCEHTGAPVGAFFVAGPDGLVREGSHGLAAAPERFAQHEGLVGQAAARHRLLHVHALPPGYLQVRSGTGLSAPTEVLLLPVRAGGKLEAVVELGFSGSAPARAVKLIESAAEPIALALCQVRARERLRALDASLAERERDVARVRAELDGTQVALRDRTEELGRSTRSTSEFLANMSHELRTPLNSTLLLATLLADNPGGQLTAEQVRYAETIHAAGQELLTLINDVLDLSQLEAGRLELHPDAVPVAAIAEELQRAFQPLAGRKQLTLTTEIDPDVPVLIHSDRERLAQVVRHLLGNALKFTETGGVTLRISRVDDEIHFAVSDTGIGIDPEQQQAIFQPFRQADGGINRKYRGPGLGLSIARQLARLLGGSVVVDSEPGSGSTFTLRLPLVAPVADLPRTLIDNDGAARRPVMEPVRRRPADDRLAGRRLLIIDSDVRNLFAMTSALEPSGATVELARNAREAIERLSRQPPVDLVLVDVDAPDMDETTRAIRSRPHLEHLPIIALTPRSTHEDEERLRSAGASDCVARTADRDRLLSVIRGWMPR